MPKQHAAASAAYREHVTALGAHRGLWAFGCGLSVADARALFATRVGNRLFDHDAADMLGDHDAAAALGVSLNDLCNLTNGGAMPESVTHVRPDVNGNTLRFRAWSVASLAAWAAAGCPNRNTGKRNHYVAEKIGAVPSGT